MNFILFDDDSRRSLLPLTHTRPVAEIRIGILKIREKWEKLMGVKFSYLVDEHLKGKFPVVVTGDNVFINGSILPDESLVRMIGDLKTGQRIVKDEIMVACRLSDSIKTPQALEKLAFADTVKYTDHILKVSNNWDIFAMNDQAISNDFTLITKGRKSAPLSSTNSIIGAENIFLEPTARVECATLNGKEGLIYIGNDAEVMEGAMIRGPFALCDHSQVKMGAKIYGATTIGPHCKVGGEISNSVIFGYTNKAHDGFLGNSVLGEWCNLGADSNNSNLKNNYSKIKVWNYKEENYVNSGLQFCGLIMGDHSKCSINTMFNTGTVVGVSANIFGNGFPPKFVPSFAWGGSEGFETYRIEDALEVAQRVYERRHIEFDETEQKLLRTLFDITTKYRAW